MHDDGLVVIEQPDGAMRDTPVRVARNGGGKTDSKDDVETVIVITVWVNSSQYSKTGVLGSKDG